jgi:hypothetical protein
MPIEFLTCTMSCRPSFTFTQGQSKRDATGIQGSLSHSQKQFLYDALSTKGFGVGMMQRLVIKEATIYPDPEEDAKTQAQVVCELSVDKGAHFIRRRGDFERDSAV